MCAALEQDPILVRSGLGLVGVAEPLKVLVGANSPSLWPTMFSVISTGTCRRPSCTAMVRATMSGMIVEALDQVRITVRELVRCASSTRLRSLGWTKGPFFTDLDMV